MLSVVGFGTKVGFVPMHTWLPDAHSEAPAPVSALLSGSLLAAAFYAILRFFQVAVANGDRAFAEHALIVFGVISLVAAAFFVLRQGNYKRLLAYSSIEHMGIVALGIGFGAPLAIAGALLHVITHASAKGLAFFGTGSLLRGYDTKQVDGVTDAGRQMPWTGPMFLAAALALSGLPLSGVFRSEFEIVCGGFAQGGWDRIGRDDPAGVRQRRVLRDHLAHRQHGAERSAEQRRPAAPAATVDPRAQRLDDHRHGRLPVRRGRARASTSPATCRRC